MSSVCLFVIILLFHFFSRSFARHVTTVGAAGSIIAGSIIVIVEHSQNACVSTKVPKVAHKGEKVASFRWL